MELASEISDVLHGFITIIKLDMWVKRLPQLYTFSRASQYRNFPTTSPKNKQLAEEMEDNVNSINQINQLFLGIKKKTDYRNPIRYVKLSELKNDLK